MKTAYANVVQMGRFGFTKGLSMGMCVGLQAWFHVCSAWDSWTELALGPLLRGPWYVVRWLRWQGSLAKHMFQHMGNGHVAVLWDVPCSAGVGKVECANKNPVLRILQP